MVFWANTRDRINQGSVYPFIGDSLATELIFGKDYPKILEAWAAEVVHYPWQLPNDITAVSQYLLMQEDQDETSVRMAYLEFMKQKLIENARARGIAPFLIEKAIEKLNEGKTFTQLADFLGYLEFDEKSQQPFSILASLPVKVYITTSCFQFLEFMLEKAKKKPKSILYAWNQPLVDYTNNAGNMVERLNLFVERPEFTPTSEEPLIIHLFGRDDETDSMVLTENDYLDFLIKLTSDLAAASGVGADPVVKDILRVLRNTLAANSSPLLLGYDLQSWDFRVLLRGLIVPKKSIYKPGLFIQLMEKDGNRAKVEEFLPRYAEQKYNLKIYWGFAQNCLVQLREKWTGVPEPLPNT